MLILKRKFRIAVLVSGRGSNLEAIIKAIKGKRLRNVKICLVISDNPEAKAIKIAKDNGIKAIYLHPGEFKTKLEGKAEEEYIKAIKKARADLIVLAGFMRIVKERFIKSFHNRIINIHPSLLPKYPGLHPHKRAIESEDKEAGCTVHFVNEITDGGKRIMQARVPIFENDTEETLAKRVLEKEHKILPAVIQMFADGFIKYETFPNEPIIYQEK